MTKKYLNLYDLFLFCFYNLVFVFDFYLGYLHINLRINKLQWNIVFVLTNQYNIELVFENFMKYLKILIPFCNINCNKIYKLYVVNAELNNIYYVLHVVIGIKK